MTALALSRRQLALAVAAGALFVAFRLVPDPALAQSAKKLPGSLEGNRMLDAWLRIDPDGTVTVFTGKVELGQGILTALRQVVAEELDVRLERIRMIAGDTAQTPDEGYTAGSQSIEYSGTALHHAAAEARAILLDLAAHKLGVAAESLAVSDGTVGARGGGGTTTYWELVSAGLLHHEATGAVALKASAEHKVIGKPAARIDIPAKVTGGASYVQDLRLPGMLFGRIARPPSYHAELASFDETPAKSVPGIVTVVRDGNFLGVVAEREEQAIAARRALLEFAHWNERPDLPEQKTLYAHFEGLKVQPHTISDKPGSGIAVAKTLAATYTRPYMAHASIGPSCAVAEFKDGALTVWSHSQGVFPLRRDLAAVLALAEERITVKHVEGSGCYGHNGADDVALDTALLARAVPGRPVKVQWMREDEFAWEPYGSAMVVRASAGLGIDGSVVDWNYAVWTNTHSTRPGTPGGANLLAGWQLAHRAKPAPPQIIPQPAGGGDRNAVPLYVFDKQKVVHNFIPEMPLRVSALRTLGAYANVFALESFLDELAFAAGADPVEFRLRHLKDARARAVIEAAARRAGWRPGAKGDGRRGRGIGFAKYKNLASYVAVVADVTVDRASGAILVERAVAAVDAGQIINPDGLTNQIEGGIVQSTSWTLKEQISFDRQRITSRDWSGYPILTFPEVPTVEVVLLDRPNERSLGAGEAAQGPTAAAIANAVHHATGARLRDLPLTPEHVKAALG